MNRRTLIQTLLAAIPIPFLSFKEKASTQWHHCVSIFTNQVDRSVTLHDTRRHTTTILPTPLRVTRKGDNFASTVMLFDENTKEIGFFEVRYNQKTKELLFFLQSKKDSEVSCLVDGWKPKKFENDGMYRIQMET